MVQSNQNFSPLAMSWNISCTICMNLSYIQGKRSSKMIRVLFNVSSNQVNLRSTKLNNTETFSKSIVTQTMQGISLTSAQSHLLITYSMAPPSTCVPINMMKLFKEVTIPIQEKYIQVWRVNTRLELIEIHGYPIGAKSKLYEKNHAAIKLVLSNRFIPQAWPINSLITDLHAYHLKQTFATVDTISNKKYADLNSKPHGGQILRDIIDCAIGARFYPPSGSTHHKLLHLDQFHKYTHRQMPSNGKSNTIQYNA